jgi:hypothetical protein
VLGRTLEWYQRLRTTPPLRGESHDQIDEINEHEGGPAEKSAYALYCGGLFLGTAAHDDVDLGNQCISLQGLQGQIDRLQAAVQTGLRKAIANPDFAAGLVNRNLGRENHPVINMQLSAR